MLDGRAERAGSEDGDDGTGRTVGGGPRGRRNAGGTTLLARVTEEERERRIGGPDEPDDPRSDVDDDTGDEEHVLAALYGDEADLEATVGPARPAQPNGPQASTDQDQQAHDMSRTDSAGRVVTRGSMAHDARR